MKKPEIEYDPLAGLRQEEDGSYTDERTGITLERCERCGELEFPVDDSYGLCIRCIEAGHTPHTY